MSGGSATDVEGHTIEKARKKAKLWQGHHLSVKKQNPRCVIGGEKRKGRDFT